MENSSMKNYILNSRETQNVLHLCRESRWWGIKLCSFPAPLGLCAVTGADMGILHFVFWSSNRFNNSKVCHRDSLVLTEVFQFQLPTAPVLPWQKANPTLSNHKEGTLPAEHPPLCLTALPELHVPTRCDSSPLQEVGLSQRMCLCSAQKATAYESCLLLKHHK